MSQESQITDPAQEGEAAATPAPKPAPPGEVGPEDFPSIIDALGSAVAAADLPAFTLRFENERFREWFPVEEGGSEDLEARVPGLDLQRAQDRLDKGRPYRFEAEVRVGPRTVSVQMQLRKESDLKGEFLLLEGQNISKQKEAEYMLDSYSRLTERQNRELEKEKERVEKLLLNIMPKSVYEELKDSGTTTPQTFNTSSRHHDR